MAREPEHIDLALKRVDLSKRFILVTIVFVFIAILFTFGSLLAHARVDDDGRWKLQFGDDRRGNGVRRCVRGARVVSRVAHDPDGTQRDRSGVEEVGR
jgi:hypothetical protein